MSKTRALKTQFAESSTDFLSHLERTIGLSALMRHPDVRMHGRSDLNGFEYFGLGYHDLDLYIPRFSGDLAVMPSAPAVKIALPRHMTEAQDMTLYCTRAVYNPWFHAERHEPIIVGQMPADAFNISAMPNASDMPIRAPGQGFMLPAEFQSLAPVIQAVDDFERKINPNYDRFFAALTVDTRDQPPGGSQRTGGVHTDGFQGTRVNPKEIGEHSYIFSFPNATIYYPSAYPELVTLDPDQFNMFSAMDVLTHQAHNGQRGRDFIKPEGNHIVLFDCYTPHEAPINESGLPVRRLFMRLTYTVRIFDRLGNSINPYLALPEYRMRNNPVNLRTPTLRDLGL